MKNQQIKVLNLNPHFINRWVSYFMEYLMDIWQIIFKQGDKHLSKLFPRSFYGGIHLLQFLNA